MSYWLDDLGNDILIYLIYQRICFFLFENSINYYIHKSSVTFQPCKITMTYFEILIDKWNCNISCLMCGLMTTN